MLIRRPPGTRVAVIAPHPDDDLLGCGATLHKHLTDHDRVTVIYLTSGERAAGLVGLSPTARRTAREAEAAAGWRTMAAERGPQPAGERGLQPAGERGPRLESEPGPQLEFLRLTDGRIVDGHDSLTGALAALAPDLVYAPSPLDAHRDHRDAARLLADCLTDLPTVALVALYEVWSPLFPNVLVDVTAEFSAKLAALAEHTSAAAAVDYRRTAHGLASYRAGALLHGEGYAEAFCVLTPSAFRELIGLL
jgi:LmbE family N-acetylglucosaminyl deacetylase